MKEQSQIEEMRAAVRGDIERAKRRRGNAPADALVAEPPPPEPEPKRGWVAALFRRR
jgi:hypothetical protein